ncbi:MAG: pentapeptide repeat-containing protein [Pirellulales bacterium]
MTKHWTFLVTASLAALLASFAPAPNTRADVFQWEYINPADPSQGKQPSTTLTPGGAGVNAVPGANLTFRDLTMGYLIGADLTGAYGEAVILTNADLSQANLTYANFAPYGNEYGIVYGDLTGANLSNAVVLGTQFTSSNLTMSQLASTASYQARNLAGIGLQGVNLAAANFASQNLTYATFNGATLTGADFNHINAAGIVLAYANLANASFDHANLANSYFGGAILQNADFSGAFLAGTHMGTSLAGVNLSAAVVRDADLTATGITAAQLYSTASYQAHDLRGVKLSGDFTGGDFAGQDFANARLNFVTFANADLGHANLVNGDFAGFLYYDDQGGIFVSPGANLAGANLTGVDSRGANLLYATLTGATMHNMIQPNGRIAGLDLTAGKSLVIRDYDGNPFVFPSTGLVPVVVQQHLVADATSALHFVFDSDAWNSTISFEPGIPVALGGTLELTFAPYVNVATQSGRTIDLFDWTGVTPTGAFTVSSPYTWNLSNLYTTGEVTLAAAPSLPGDFNLDGTVDAADYVVWRKNYGTPAAYNVWRTHFGQTAGSGSGTDANAAVPEPSTLVLLLFAATGWCRRRGQPASKVPATHLRVRLVNNGPILTHESGSVTVTFTDLDEAHVAASWRK